MRAATTSISAAGALVVTALALQGCAVRTRPAVSYVELSSAPVDVSGYPHTYYDGRDVYFVNERWMYNDGGRWVYYNEEPAPLYRYRRYAPAYPQSAPPAYRQPQYTQPRYAPPQSAPPAYRPPYRTPAQPQVAPPASAPPAVRTQ